MDRLQVYLAQVSPAPAQPSSSDLPVWYQHQPLASQHHTAPWHFQHSDNVIIFFLLFHFLSILPVFSFNFLWLISFWKAPWQSKYQSAWCQEVFYTTADNSSFLLPPCSGVWSLQHCSTLLMYLLVCSTGGSYPILSYHWSVGLGVCSTAALSGSLTAGMTIHTIYSRNTAVKEGRVDLYLNERSPTFYFDNFLYTVVDSLVSQLA